MNKFLCPHINRIQAICFIIYITRKKTILIETPLLLDAICLGITQIAIIDATTTAKKMIAEKTLGSANFINFGLDTI